MGPENPGENTALFERVADALVPSGRVFVSDQWAGTGRRPVRRADLRFVALTYFTSLGAIVYDPDGATAWLREAGFADITRQSVSPLSGLALIDATKQ